MRQVWGWEYGDQSTVTVHVRRLREKIERNPAEPRLLTTVWGVGYRLDLPVDAGIDHSHDSARGQGQGHGQDGANR